MEVQAQYDAASLVAQHVEAGDFGNNGGNQADVEGTVTLTTTNSVTTNPKDGGPQLTHTVDSFTKIEIDGASGIVDQIPIGSSAEAECDTKTLVASHMSVNAAGEDEPSH
jgi:hypothetical protein